MKTKPLFFCVLLSFLSFLMCDTRSGDADKAVQPMHPDTTKSPKKIFDTTHIAGRWTIKDFYSTDTLLNKKVDSIYKLMNTGERASQMIMPATGVSKKYGLPFSQVVELYKQKMIGGVLFLKGTRKLFTDEIKSLNYLTRKNKDLPLVYSCDCEPTLFHRKFTDADSMTVASALITREDVTESAAKISAEMKKMGIHWNFAPVADVYNDQSIINERSFSGDAPEVVSKAGAFIQSSADENIVTTIKHFPGHGAVTGDSHRKVVYIDGALTELNNFDSIIKEFAPVGVMVGHIAIKNNSVYNTDNLPSSLSIKIVTGLLKINEGFNGIVVTDAMNMGAVRNIPNADYLAILAGNDMVLMPQNAKLLHSKIVSLLLNNKKMQPQLEKSIKKILRLKICMGIIT